LSRCEGDLTLDWPQPIVQLQQTTSGTRVEATIREIPFCHRVGEEKYWEECRRRWRACDGKDYSVWRKYRHLVESGQYHFAGRQGKSVYGFAEALTALALHRHGFKCWTGVHLFGRAPKGAMRRVANTAEVEKLLCGDGFMLPRQLDPSLARRAKNPDVVAYQPHRREWRFCEVKRGEAVQRDQVVGLTILHLLTGAPVAIVRLGPGYLPKSGTASARFEVQWQIALSR
jgi:hypothetical protein